MQSTNLFAVAKMMEQLECSEIHFSQERIFVLQDSSAWVIRAYQDLNSPEHIEHIHKREAGERILLVASETPNTGYKVRNSSQIEFTAV